MRYQEKNEETAFYLQDPNDGFCLAGGEFKRCAIDTLWYAMGDQGNYTIHKREKDDGKGETGCLERTNCAGVEGKVKVGKCKACGAKDWKVIGDTEKGYVLSAGDGETCLVRDGNTAKMIECEGNLHFMNLQCKYKSFKTFTGRKSHILIASSYSYLKRGH